MTAHGSFHWNELLTADVERAKRFYGETIGWTYQPMPMPDSGTLVDGDFKLWESTAIMQYIATC